MLRTITLSLLMLISIGVMLPFADSTAHGIRNNSASRHSRYRRHSRAWWRRHRARMKRLRIARMAHRNAPLNPALPTRATVADGSTAALPQLPAGWNNVAANKTEMQFRTDTGQGAVPGQAALSVVALSRPNPAYVTSREQRRILAGASFSELRRIVIDKMVNAGGWVTNDFERDVTGSRVFVVTARTPADPRTPEKSWNFYFTEVDGRIYSLTTNTPPQYSNRMAAEAEGFISALHSRGIKTEQK